MGDPARFRVFADYVCERWPDRSLRIADVAGGHGHLNAEMYRRGYRQVVTFDKRRKRWTERPHYRYGTFGRHTERGFDLILGMHPDEASDEIIAYSAEHRVPFALVPCCIKPSRWPYDGPRDRTSWADHLAAVAESQHLSVDDWQLPITGSRRLLVGVPS